MEEVFLEMSLFVCVHVAAVCVDVLYNMTLCVVDPRKNSQC